jgi:hypothetical protein
MENEDQELGWAPQRYPTYSAYEPGEWRTVQENGEPVGFVWTNNGTGAGVKWIKQTETVTEIHKMFLSAAAGSMPAPAAFGAVESKFGDQLGDSNLTALGDADEFLNSLDED